MFDQMIGRLMVANELESNAKRLRESRNRPANWADIYLECLGEASRQRAAARRMAVHVQNQARDWGQHGGQYQDVLTITVGQLLLLSRASRSAPPGSKRMRYAAGRIKQVAALLADQKAMAQLMWWCAEVEPMPPGRPVLDREDREVAGE